MAHAVTSVGEKIVSVVTFLVGVHDGIAAAREGTIRAAVAVGTVRVSGCQVAAFAEVQVAVTAGDQYEAAIGIAGQIAHERGFTLLSVEALHDGVSAEAALEETDIVATVAVQDVAVVTFFVGRDARVAAEEAFGGASEEIIDLR